MVPLVPERVTGHQAVYVGPEDMMCSGHIYDLSERLRSL